MAEPVRQFDLNIEKVLEHWSVAHAVREVIANALDEQVLTGTAAPSITRDAKGAWHIRDYGRGMRYEHLTQNENKDKLRRSAEVIGKFGVGLKDAFATFDRHRVGVSIRSRHATISIGKVPKHGFEDIKTLHALVGPPSDRQMEGTDVVLSNLKDDDVEKAKAFFLQFSAEQPLDVTPYGAVFKRPRGKKSRIYVNGLLVAEEDNFLFTYNVTSLTTALRRALNRERTNVGRSAYSERVKAILLASSAPTVAEALASELPKFESGRTHDELAWMDVQLHACKTLSATEKVVFVTSQQMYTNGNLVNYAKSDGYRIVVIPTQLAAKLPGLVDGQGQPVLDLTGFYHTWDSGFTFKFVEPERLAAKERAVFAQTARIVELLGKAAPKISQVLISETMRIDASGYQVQGLWRPEDRSVVILRDQLKDIARYAGTLLHELTHARSGTSDRTLEFEVALTDSLGSIADRAMKGGRTGRAESKTRREARPMPHTA